ncbi:hypothetical protein GW17_00014856 [Ensete ventricosum]|nr:hypothetical protein GW17_00014856 [Ensete ventricosum]
MNIELNILPLILGQTGEYQLKHTDPIKDCNFDLYSPVWAVQTGLPGYRYADRLLPRRYRKNRSSAIDFGRLRSIEGEKGKKKKKKRKRRNKKKRGRRKKYLAPSLLATGGPFTGNLADRYVPPRTGRYKSKLQTLVRTTNFHIDQPFEVPQLGSTSLVTPHDAHLPPDPTRSLSSLPTLVLLSLLLHFLFLVLPSYYYCYYSSSSTSPPPPSWYCNMYSHTISHSSPFLSD